MEDGEHAFFAAAAFRQGGKENLENMAPAMQVELQFNALRFLQVQDALDALLQGTVADNLQVMLSQKMGLQVEELAALTIDGGNASVTIKKQYSVLHVL